MTFNFGSSNFGSANKPAFGSPGFSFGSPATSTTSNTFGGFGSSTATTSTGFGGFGSTPTTSTASFGGFGGAPATSNTGFGTFGSTPASTSASPFGGFGTTQTTSAAPAFGGFGTTTTTSSLFPSFGTNTGSTSGGSLFGSTGTTGFGGAGSLFGSGSTGFGSTNTNFGAGTGGFGSGTAPPFGSTTTGFGGNTTGGFGSTFGSNAPTFGGSTGLGSSFNAKPLGMGTTGFAGFGGTTSNLNVTSAFGQPQQPQNQANPNEALMNAIFNCNIFGDERDQILAKLNFLQAKWGFGKAYYSNNQAPIELTEQNPLCRFKAIGYNCFLNNSDKDGLVQLLFNKTEQEIKTQQQQLQNSLVAVLGNKPTLNITIDSIKSVGEAKTRVIIYVVEKSATGGTGSKIPASELAQFLNGNVQRQQLTSLGVTSAMPHARPEPKELQDYLETPPPGIDIRLWKQAQADNPNPEKYFPYPMIGFSEVKWRMRCQEEETQIHATFLAKAADEIADLKSKLASATATLQEQRRRFAQLHHRLLTVVVRQESTRRAGAAITPEEEALRSRLEALHSQLSAPTQFNGRLSELLSQMRMQRSQGLLQKSERYSMDQASQDDIKQFLAMQHQGMTHLIETVNLDITHLKLIHEGLNKIVQEAE